MEELDETDELGPADPMWLPKEQEDDIDHPVMDCSGEPQIDESNLTTQEVDDEYQKQGDDKGELNSR